MFAKSEEPVAPEEPQPEPGPQPEPAPPFGPTPEEPLPEPSPEPSPEAGETVDPSEDEYVNPEPQPEPERTKPDVFAPPVPGQEPVEPEPEIEPLDIGNLFELTKDDLYQLAQERDIEGRSDMSKPELIAALQQYAVDNGKTGPDPTPISMASDEPVDPQQFPVVDPDASVPLAEYQRVMEENQRLQAEINKIKAEQGKDSV